jgi:predicted enzyme related to lactoylglutathione lyase
MSGLTSGKVIGIGGAFFRSPDPAALARWYSDTLGFPVEDWGDTSGCSFAPDRMPPHSFTVWGAFRADTEYFGKSSQQFMLNLVVDDLDQALDRVARAGGRVLPEREDQDYGRFGWFVDPDGHRVELWEPPATPPEDDGADHE